ncbi:unnamed protein product, partial [Staurois parvus]
TDPRTPPLAIQDETAPDSCERQEIDTRYIHRETHQQAVPSGGRAARNITSHNSLLEQWDTPCGSRQYTNTYIP